MTDRSYNTALIDSFYKDCSDLDFKTEIKKNVEVILPGKETILFAKNSSKITCDDLIKQNKGKVIYIDFWASWCVPCLQQMPSSFKLHLDLENFPISFIYFYMDKSNSSWETKANALKLNENSFLVTNNFQST